MVLRSVVIVAAICFAVSLNGCRPRAVSNANAEPASQEPPSTPSLPEPTPQPTSPIPNLQAELLGGGDSTTSSPIGGFDFKNFTYELPRGWQNPDGTSEVRLTNGKIAPVETDINDKMDDEEKADAKALRRIGLSFVTVKYFDLTGDGQDEAVVVLKIETGGSAIPQIGYVFTWKDGQPELLWPFRTGDRADGGLKSIRAENGMFVVELFGQDRFLLGQVETGKITNDIEQLCCPTFFTRSIYKWNGKNFILQGKRQTLSMSEPNAAPVENMGDKVNSPQKGKK